MGMSRYDIVLGRTPPPPPPPKEPSRLLVVGIRRSGKTQMLIEALEKLVDDGIPFGGKMYLCAPNRMSIETMSRIRRRLPVDCLVPMSYNPRDLARVGGLNTLGVFCEEIQEYPAHYYSTGLEDMLYKFSKLPQGRVVATCDANGFIDMARGSPSFRAINLDETIDNMWFGRHDQSVPTNIKFFYAGAEWNTCFLPNRAFV